MPRSISIVLPDLRGGGAERVSIDLARALAGAGHQVEFILMSATGDFLEEAERDFEVIDLSAGRTRGSIVKLAKAIHRRRPDVIIANMWPLTSAAVVGRALSGHRAKLLLVEHNTLSNQYSSWGALHNLCMRASMQATYRWADHIAAVSEGAAADTARLAALPGARVAVLHNPIPARPSPEGSARSAAEALWGCPPGLRILTVGSLKDQKNHCLLLRAFAKVSAPAAHLMLLGQGENEVMLRDLARELGIADRVVFAGFQGDPSPFYATADMFVLSSDYEGLPTVLIEALSFGLPIVSTDCPSGPAEILEEGRYGILTPLGDADGLARSIEDGLSRAWDRAAQRRRSADFSPAVSTKRYLDLLGLT